MILYAAYIDGNLLDQVAAETEDTALAKLRMDYPKLEGTVAFEIIDGNHKAPVKKEEVKETTGDVSTKAAPSGPIKVIEADSVHITLNVTGTISNETIAELEEAAKSGMIVAKSKGA